MVRSSVPSFRSAEPQIRRDLPAARLSGEQGVDPGARSGKSGSYPLEGIDVNVNSLSDAIEQSIGRARSGEGFALFTLNLDHLVKMKQDRVFYRAYQRAALITADGWPVVWLANRMGRKLQRTCGSDLVDPVCESAAANAMPVFFIGPGMRSQSTAIAILQSRYADLEVAGSFYEHISIRPGWFELKALAARINSSGARICFLSLGAPKQELLADALSSRCPSVGFLCVGAALDFISGEAQRAPPGWQKAGLEWAWRLLGDPRRLATRYAYCAFALVRLAMKPAPAPVRL